jgi:hypothetical protein
VFPARCARLPGQALPEAEDRGTFGGIEPVDTVTRLCAMNLLLDGIGETESGSGVPPLQSGEQSRDGSATLSATLSPAFVMPVLLNF